MIKMSSMSEGDHDADDEALFEDSFNFESQVLAFQQTRYSEGVLFLFNFPFLGPQRS